MLTTIIDLFCKYSGNGLAVGLFFLALIYLLIREKDKNIRIVLVYTTIVITILFFCPVFAAVIYRFMDEEIYYRILWLLPMTVVIAYAGVKLIGSVRRKWLQALVTVLLAAVIILTGDYVYDNPYFSRAENRFHVPQTVALVCDEIIVEGREVRAVMPTEMLPFVRQYTANVCMPYGREIMVESWKYNNPLYDAMEAYPVDCRTVAELASAQSCHYIVLQEAKELVGTFEENGYSLVNTTAGYHIYLQDGADLSLE